MEMDHKYKGMSEVEHHQVFSKHYQCILYMLNTDGEIDPLWKRLPAASKEWLFGNVLKAATTCDWDWDMHIDAEDKWGRLSAEMLASRKSGWDADFVTPGHAGSPTPATAPEPNEATLDDTTTEAIDEVLEMENSPNEGTRGLEERQALAAKRIISAIDSFTLKKPNKPNSYEVMQVMFNVMTQHANYPSIEAAESQAISNLANVLAGKPNIKRAKKNFQAFSLALVTTKTIKTWIEAERTPDSSKTTEGSTSAPDDTQDSPDGRAGSDGDPTHERDAESDINKEDHQRDMELLEALAQSQTNRPWMPNANTPREAPKPTDSAPLATGTPMETDGHGAGAPTAPAPEPSKKEPTPIKHMEAQDLEVNPNDPTLAPALIFRTPRGAQGSDLEAQLGINSTVDGEAHTCAFPIRTLISKYGACASVAKYLHDRLRCSTSDDTLRLATKVRYPRPTQKRQYQAQHQVNASLRKTHTAKTKALFDNTIEAMEMFHAQLEDASESQSNAQLFDSKTRWVIPTKETMANRALELRENPET